MAGKHSPVYTRSITPIYLLGELLTNKYVMIAVIALIGLYVGIAIWPLMIAAMVVWLVFR